VLANFLTVCDGGAVCLWRGRGFGGGGESRREFRRGLGQRSAKKTARGVTSPNGGRGRFGVDGRPWEGQDFGFKP